MATFLDIGLVQQANWLFAFVLVFVLLYAILSYKKLFDMSKMTASTIAICIAFMMLLSPAFLNIVAAAVPWFAIAIIFIVFLLLTMFTLGVTPEDMTKTLNGPQYGSSIKSFVVIIASIIIIGAIASQFSVFTGGGSEPSGETIVNANGEIVSQSGDVGGKGQDALIAILFHPQVLGLLAIMVIAIFATILLSSNVR
jgi:magnesium-transporting ATPase (P-type)